MRRIASILGASFLVLAVLASSAFATQILYRSPKQMGTESSHVVLGKVVSVQSYWNEKHTKIFTETQVKVEETYKGGYLPEVRIVQLGGIVGHVKMTVAGALSWKPGEEVVLFLEPYDSKSHQVSGFSQGKFEIERDPSTGERFIKRPVSLDLEVIGVPEGEESKPASGTKKVSVGKFINKALGRN